MAPEISVAILAFNEVASLRSTIEEITSVLESVGKAYEVVIVNDGSTDGTGQAADAMAMANNNVRVVHHQTNLGLGGVYRTGFATARGEFLTFFPADGQFPADILRTFVPKMISNDLVLGYLPARTDSVVGKVLSSVERMLYTALFGRLPKFQGVFMARRQLLVALPLRSNGRGWAILMEFIIRAVRARWRIESVPTSLRPRANGRSKVNNLKNITSNFAQMVALRRLL